jgi:hypothetical protein
MNSTLRDDPKYWRDRAEEAGEHAKQVVDVVSRNTLLVIAQSYEFLAWRAEQNLLDCEKFK